MRFSPTLLFVVTALLAAPSAFAASNSDWTCRNTDMEISCSKGTCSSSKPGEFTPMSVSLSGQTLNVCAYSGCWDGKAATLTDQHLIYAHSDTMIWSGPDKKDPATFQFALNKTQKLAVIIGEGFAQPVHCKPAD